MKSHDNRVDPAKSDETNMDQLGQEELQDAAGGSIFGDVWGGIKAGADDVGGAASSAYNWTKSEAEAHPDIANIAKGIAIVGAMATGVGAGAAAADAITGAAEADADKLALDKAVKRFVNLWGSDD
ncbi:hypothetical protein [Martelella soudanensis]|uniref:hypothetical protein n=1 Tax=unclassified Martelella TaxID=2629616 RepID=UPI0015DEF23E|nr:MULTISPECIES: hypothetical protein [unclassified Martelella]